MTFNRYRLILGAAIKSHVQLKVIKNENCRGKRKAAEILQQLKSWNTPNIPSKSLENTENSALVEMDAKLSIRAISSDTGINKETIRQILPNQLC